jgi:hypothetical protein
MARHWPTWILNCRWKGVRRISNWYCRAMLVSSRGPPQSGANARQRRLVNLIDPVGGGRLAVGRGAVISTGFVAGLLGLAGGSALGERSGLALTGAGRLVELAA